MLGHSATFSLIGTYDGASTDAPFFIDSKNQASKSEPCHGIKQKPVRQGDMQVMLL